MRLGSRRKYLRAPRAWHGCEPSQAGGALSCWVTMRGMEATALSLVVLRSGDLEASLAFYRALGLELVEERHGAGPIHYSCDFGGLGSLVLELYAARLGSSESLELSAEAMMLGFRVPSLEAALAELRQLGVEPKAAPKDSAWGRWVSVVDPGGRTVQISEAPRS